MTDLTLIAGRRCGQTARLLAHRARLEAEGHRVVEVRPDGVLVRDPDHPAYVEWRPLPDSPTPAHRRVEADHFFA